MTRGRSSRPLAPFLTPALALAAAIAVVPGAVVGADGTDDTDRSDAFVGYWSGAYLRLDSVLPVHVRIERTDDGGLVRREEYPDWIHYGWLGPEPARIDESGRLVMPSRYGEAVLAFDPDYRELIGPSGARTPPVTLHLKRTVPPPRITVTPTEVAFETDVPLRGTLVLPEGPGPHPCVVFLHGRGCATRSYALELGTTLARYGIAALAYDKRGAGASGGACATTTFAQTVDDAEAALRRAAAHPAVDADRIGVLGTSAGAWTAQGLAARALATPDRGAVPAPAFIITWIGPATSIRDQQFDSTRALARQLGLTPGQEAAALRVLELETDPGADPRAVHDELVAIRDRARDEGWADRMFEPDDFPAAPDRLDELWLRRFRFDPTDTLRRLRDVPYLAVFGAEDAVVPFERNGPRLRALLTAAGNDRFEIIALPGIGHAFEHGDEVRSIPGTVPTVTYQKFDRVEVGFLDATVRFLRELGMMSR